MATAKKSKGLGKGLNTMIPEKLPKVSQETSESPMMVTIDKVEPDREQPRKKFDEDALQDLAESEKQFGILQPLLVTKETDYYKIIAGERRWRAARIAGLKEVPIIVKELTDKEIAEIQLIENIQREDLNPIEVAEGYKLLIDKYDFTQDQLAERISKSRTAITNTLRLLKLDPRVREMIIDERLTQGHGRALLGVEDGDKQYELAMKIFDSNMNVREVEKMVKSLEKNKDGKKAKTKIDKKTEAIYQSLEENMKQILGTKVSIQAKDNKQGKLEIEYYSPEELDRIVNMIQTIRR